MPGSKLTEAQNALQEKLLFLYHKREQLKDELSQDSPRQSLSMSWPKRTP